MSSSTKMKPSHSTVSRQHVQYKSLASYLKYLEGEQLTVELKNGRQCAGILVRAEEPSMNLTLQTNNPNSSNDDDNNDKTQLTNTKLTHIRGAAIRYIYFGDDYMECIRAAQDREQSALQKYRRGLRNRSFSGFERQVMRIMASSPLPSPYSVCPKCRGEGKLRQRQSKKARFHAQNNNSTLQQKSINLKPCNPCQGSGLQPRDSDQEVDASAALKNLPSVAIIGGGIGGLALGIACWHRDIPFTIYERDTSFRQRQQGYGLTLQQASKALKGFGIELEGGITSTRHVVHTPDGEEIGEWGLRKWGRDSQKSVRRQNVHIARQALREQLLNGVGNQVEWDHQLVSLSESDDNVELTFSQKDGTTKTAKADLVVGADGIRSTIRNLLIGDTKSPLQYLGCIVILGICPLDAIEGASESELLDGHTVFQTADGTTRLYCMPFSSTEYMWQLSYPVDEKVAIVTSREKRLKEAALEKCGEWHSPLPQLLDATPPELVSGYPVYDRALLETEMLSFSNRITLLGDSAHPMSPFKGQGANQAMLDALSLARALYKNPEGNFVETYQEEMLVRSAVKVKASADAADFLHTDVAIQKGNVTRGAAAAKEQKSS